MENTRSVKVYKVRAEDFRDLPESLEGLSSGAELRADFSQMPEFEQDALCRVLISGIKEAFKDPAIQDDFEKWRAERAARKAAEQIGEVMA